MYGLAKDGTQVTSKQEATIKITDSTSNKTKMYFKPLTMFINSPIYKNAGNGQSDSIILPNRQWVYNTLLVIGKDKLHNSNSLSCADKKTYSEKSKCKSNSKNDPFDIMGLGNYATDINCYNKIRLGWIKKSETYEVAIKDVNRSVLVQPLSSTRSKKKCIIVHIPKSKLDDSDTEYDKVFLEYRS